MSTKNFVSYGDAETLFTGVGNKISGKQAKPTTISYADWLLLTPQQQETGNWLVTGVPGADLSLRVLALETNKQDKTDNNLQTTSKETTGAINELKSGLINPVGGTVVVTLPANSAYGFFYFLFPSTAFAFGKTVTITGAYFIGDSTELKDYISPEHYNATDIGRIYKINTTDITGVSAETYGNPLLITYTVA